MIDGKCKIHIIYACEKHNINCTGQYIFPIIHKYCILYIVQLTQYYMGENEYGKSGHLSIFTYFKHLLLKLIFRASFLCLIQDTDSMYGHAAQIFKSKNIVKQCL